MSHRVALLWCVLLAAGCGPSTPAPSTQTPLTRQFIRVTQEVPAFGGVTREGGAWAVSVLDASQQASAAARLQDIFGAEAATISVRTRPARGRASEAMKESAQDVLGVAGVGSLDFDETTDYLRVGLVDIEAVEPAQAKLDALGISRGDVILQVTPTLVAR